MTHANSLSQLTDRIWYFIVLMHLDSLTTVRSVMRVDQKAIISPWSNTLNMLSTVSIAQQFEPIQNATDHIRPTVLMVAEIYLRQNVCKQLVNIFKKKKHQRSPFDHFSLVFFDEDSILLSISWKLRLNHTSISGLPAFPVDFHRIHAFYLNGNPIVLCRCSVIAFELHRFCLKETWETAKRIKWIFVHISCQQRRRVGVWMSKHLHIGTKIVQCHSIDIEEVGIDFQTC